MTNVFLGIIAISVLVMATIQVALILVAARTARQLSQLAERLERDIRPIMSSIQTLTTDAARATALAAAQVERVDRVFTDLTKRIDQVLGAIPSFMGTARNGFTLVTGIKTFLSILRDLRASVAKRSSNVEEEDALFIG